jgi:nucleotide-binding universal stress UspA family protein
MLKKLMVAYNGTEDSIAAFQFGLDLAKKYGASLVVLSVVRLPEPPEEEEAQALIESGKAHYESLFKTLKKHAKEEGVVMETHILIGPPAEQIVHWAQESKVDLVLLGHHKRSKFGRWLLGGTADRVMDHAGCSVIVVKEKEPATHG